MNKDEMAVIESKITKAADMIDDFVKAAEMIDDFVKEMSAEPKSKTKNNFSC